MKPLTELTLEEKCELCADLLGVPRYAVQTSDGYHLRRDADPDAAKASNWSSRGAAFYDYFSKEVSDAHLFSTLAESESICFGEVLWSVKLPPLPYATSLDVMHEAEKTLTIEQQNAYVNRLDEFALDASEGEQPLQDFLRCCSTAAQRLDAFLTLKLTQPSAGGGHD